MISLRNTVTLVGGAASSQILIALSSLLLARVYAPDDFGTFGFYLSTILVFGVFSTLRFELAIPIVKSHRRANALFLLSNYALCILTSISVFAAFYVGLVKSDLQSWLSMESGAVFLWPIGFFLFGRFRLETFKATRLKKFGAISSARIVQAAFMISAQVLAIPYGAVGLIFGHVLGLGVAVSVLLYSGRNEVFYYKVSAHYLFSTAAKYRQFPVYSTWGALFNTLGSQVPMLILYGAFSATIAGHFALAQRVVMSPVAIVGQAVSQVFLSESGDSFRAGTLGSKVSTLVEFSAKIVLPLGFVFFLYAETLVVTVFGPSWSQASQILQVVAPWAIAIFIGSPLSTLFAVLNLEKQAAIIQLFLLLIRGGLMFWLSSVYTPQVGIFAFSAVSTVYWLGFVYWVFRKLGTPISETLKAIALEMIFIGSGVVILYLLSVFGILPVLICAALSLSLAITRVFYIVKLTVSKQGARGEADA